MDPSRRFAELMGEPEPALPLGEAALLVAAHAHRGLDVAAQLARIDDIANGCGSGFEGWRQHLFGRLGFRGDPDSYYDPANSMLDSVMDRQRGIPISLAVLGLEVARRTGVELVGVGMPGHFLLRHEGSPRCYIDAFAGGELLDRDGCELLFANLHTGAVLGDDHLRPVGSLAILDRMLANLASIYSAVSDTPSLAWVLRLRVQIPASGPEARLALVGHRQSLARVLSALGQYGEAADQLEAVAPELAGRQDETFRRAAELRARLN